MSTSRKCVHIHSFSRSWSANMIPVLSLQSASRDPERSPMQWSGDMNAGFNIKTNITWLPVHPDYRSVNVEVQNSFNTVPTLEKHLARACSSWSYFTSWMPLPLFLGPKERWRLCSGSVPFPEHPASVRAPSSPWMVLLCPRWRQCLLLPQRAGWAWPSFSHSA